MLKIFILYCSCLLLTQAIQFPPRWARSAVTKWHGKWFPQEPGAVVDKNPEVEYEPKHDSDLPETLHHQVPMGVSNNFCDNGKDNLTFDWDGSPINYTCFDDKQKFLPNPDVHPILHCDHIPVAYEAEHFCMETPIEYDELVPTFGPHRPLWAKYGEYLFLPKQRWLHNLEHGAVVMLYHPCANKNEVLLLKHLVKKCLYRHIITPYNMLSPKRPLALVTWGCRFMMSKVDPKLVVEFIKHAALQGPECLSKNGQYEYALLQNAEIISDNDDNTLCPNLV